MSIKIHLPDNSEFFSEKNYFNNIPEVGKNFCICYDPEYHNDMIRNRCRRCFKCYNSIVVEKTEDNTEIWIEYVQRLNKRDMGLE